MERTMKEAILVLAATVGLAACAVPSNNDAASSTVSNQKPLTAANPWQGTESWAQWNRDHPSPLRD
jgi:ABC-type glycerol-3-phosphate transport system substrate-binding protein